MSDKTTLDCSDIDHYLGKPIQPARLREPLATNDIRRWVQAMHYPNRLHYDVEFAAEGRYSRIVAPLSLRSPPMTATAARLPVWGVCL